MRNGLTINAKTEVILEKLKENRKKHIEIYDEAMKNFKSRAIELLKKKIEEINSSQKIEAVSVQLKLPQSYVKEYDMAIRALEYNVDDTIQLDQDQIEKYINDNWQWMDSFLVGSMNYSAQAVEYGASRGLR